MSSRITRDELAARVAADIPEGAVVNLGIGAPTLVADHLPVDLELLLHTENGLLGMGPTPAPEWADPDVINAGKQAVTALLGASYFHHADSFAMMRGGHLDICVLGALQVAQNGDLANWLDPARIDDVIFGDANQAGEDNRNVARFGALLAGFPTSVTGVTVNRLCASSLEAVIQGARAIESGDAEIILAGGVESMSRAPYVVEKSAKAFPATGNQTMWNTAIGARMINPALPTAWSISNGEAAERIAVKAGITSEDQDAFAVRSHQRAAKAWAEGVYDDEIVQVEGAALVRDEGIRDGSTVERLAGLRALFADGGSVTAGNSSSINDGASVVLLGAEGALDSEPLARITGRAAHGVDPDDFPIAPIKAANKALAPGRTSTWSS